MSDTPDLTDRLEHVDGLHALCRAAAVLEQRTAEAFPDLTSQREKRNLAAYLRRFEPPTQPRQRKRARAVEAVEAVEAVSLVGRIVWKKFNDEDGRPKVYRGQVASVSCASRTHPFDFGAGVTATVKYLVHYDDGDSEDLKHADVLKCLRD